MARPRVEEQVELLLEWGVDIEQGDMVTVFAPEHTTEMVTTLHAELGALGAEPVTVRGRLSTNIGLSGEHVASFLANHESDPMTPTHLKSLTEASDAIIAIIGGTNRNVVSHVPRETQERRGEAMAPIVQDIMEMMEKAVLVMHPTDAFAQYAGMSLPELEDFVYETSLRDWAAQDARQERVRERLEAAEEAHIVAPDTDIRMSLDGMHAINDVGALNFPPGEVFTAPVVDSVEGEIRFDKPAMLRGKEVKDIHLTLEDGIVTDYSARGNEEALESVLETDAGSSRIGEFGIGMNDDIDRFTKLGSFDEKMGGTIHLALGRAYDGTVGEERQQNQSSVHIDLIRGMSEGRLELDGEVVQEGGEFVGE